MRTAADDGLPVDGAVRQQAEQLSGRSFSDVRIHTDQVNRALGASADLRVRRRLSAQTLPAGTCRWTQPDPARTGPPPAAARPHTAGAAGTGVRGAYIWLTSVCEKLIDALHAREKLDNTDPDGYQARQVC